ncbi:MAG: cytochrome P460 family protein [Bacteroidales bacterium]|nr:cytochrome P460 family protein [Bacteroidales bacterium]MCF8337954.1 cytochrome P460 family protein [Bacteroidales bacterium]
MKKWKIYFLGLLLVGFATSCENDDNGDNNVEEPYEATQADLDGSTNPVDLGVTGTPYGEDVTVAHNGQPISPDSTIRDIYTGLGDVSDEIQKGTVFTKHTFMKNPDGTKGELAVTFAMIKREADYYPEGGDWEYVVMPNDGSTDYDEHPNGVLPDAESDSRGRLANCASCHASADGNNFLFTK